jgi:hypothetical protein
MRYNFSWEMVGSAATSGRNIKIFFRCDFFRSRVNDERYFLGGMAFSVNNDFARKPWNRPICRSPSRAILPARNGRSKSCLWN